MLHSKHAVLPQLRIAAGIGIGVVFGSSLDYNRLRLIRKVRSINIKETSFWQNVVTLYFNRVS